MATKKFSLLGIFPEHAGKYSSSVREIEIEIERERETLLPENIPWFQKARGLNDTC
jgi:hypothetical protein